MGRPPGPLPLIVLRFRLHVQRHLPAGSSWLGARPPRERCDPSGAPSLSPSPRKGIELTIPANGGTVPVDLLELQLMAVGRPSTCSCCSRSCGPWSSSQPPDADGLSGGSKPNRRSAAPSWAYGGDSLGAN